nr:hypothetical protein [Chloroflexota bacterium]
MHDDRLRRLLGALDEPATPDSAFADRLYTQLATDLRLEEAARPVRRPLLRWLNPSAEVAAPRAASRRRGPWALVLVGAVLLGVGGFAALATQRTGFSCTSEAIHDVRAALERVHGYTYTVSGTIRFPNDTDQYEIQTEGAYAAPDRARERFRPEGDLPLYNGQLGVSELVQVGSARWFRSEPIVPGGHEWFDDGGRTLDPDLPNLGIHPPDTASFVLDGWSAEAVEFTWVVEADTEQQSADCILHGRRVWSVENGAVQDVTAWVNDQTGLPTRLRHELTGFQLGGAERSRDWRLDYDIVYPDDAPIIVPPAADDIYPVESFDHGLFFPPGRVVLAVEGTAVLGDGGGYLRITASDISEVQSYPGSTALPWNRFMQVRLTYEALRHLGSQEANGQIDWVIDVDDLRYVRWGGPLTIIGGPEPRLGTFAEMTSGAVEEG